VLLITGESQQVRAGAAVGAVLSDEKPKILLNLNAAAAQGARFDSRLFHLAEIVR
jgi:hypothetical protein